ncbi:hypothetical protein Chor_012523 [Crotalus horridus]
MAQASLLACEGLSGVCLVPTVASKKMMPKQSSKQVENGERGGAPDMLGHRKESEKSRSRKEEETAEGSPPKKSLKKAGNGDRAEWILPGPDSQEFYLRALFWSIPEQLSPQETYPYSYWLSPNPYISMPFSNSGLNVLQFMCSGNKIVSFKTSFQSVALSLGYR